MAEQANTQIFRQKIADAAGWVLNCEVCRQGAPAKYGLPQPGWIGPQFQQGRGVVFILQNPAVSSGDYGDTREMEMQQLLQTLMENPTADVYARYADRIIQDVTGSNTGRRAWRKWTHPVSKVAENPQRIAWMNVVKFRTPGQNRKDSPLEEQAIKHGLHKHLGPELELLQPLAVVTIGNEAKEAVDQLTPTWRHRYHLKLQGASIAEALDIRNKLRRLE